MTLPTRPVDVAAIAELPPVQRARLSHLLRRIARNPKRHPYTAEAALVVANALAPANASTGGPSMPTREDVARAIHDTAVPEQRWHDVPVYELEYWGRLADAAINARPHQ